ncbi:MAG: acetyl-CoA C-acetyltransferase [Gammaproteobacteria bacterium]|nr:acetyl-CoA C-acetyltransferase [Gammaproteobacteria bacterium]
MSEHLTPVIVGSQRTAFARAFGAYAGAGNLALLTHVLNALVDRYALSPNSVDLVVAGAVSSHARDWNLAREATVRSKLGREVSAITSTIACGTSLSNALIIADKIRSGEIDVGIAAGADTISDSPIAVSPKLNQRLIKLSRAKTPLDKLKVASKGFSLAELAPNPMTPGEPMTGLSMGEHAQLMANEWSISRGAQDAWAMGSHQKASAAFADGFHDDLIAPFNHLHRDDNLREQLSADDMARLKPVFDRKKGTLTAANSTPLTDGAGAVLIASEAWAKAQGLPVLAYLRSGQVASMDYVSGEGLLIAPTLAIAKQLRRANYSLADFDLFEIHEAFAAQVLCTLRALANTDYCTEKLGHEAALGEIPHDKINPTGSSLAYGHPFAATGARLLGSAAKQLSMGRAKRALLSVCTAAGQGVVAVLEAPN